MPADQPELGCASRPQAAVLSKCFELLTDITSERKSWQATQCLETMQQTGRQLLS